MAIRFREEEEDEEEEESYLASYSDLVTDLMAIFVLLFSFAMMATAQQNYSMKQEIQQHKNQIETVASGDTAEDIAAQDDLDMLYQAVKKRIEESEYRDGISLERGPGYITFKFKDSVLFYPDSPVMRTDSFDILSYIGELIASIQGNIANVEISGHTAKVSEDEAANTIAWSLSSNRAIAVLKFFVDDCGIPEAKMAVAGYAHYRPVSDNDSEEGRSMNRRVEIKISRAEF